MYVFMDSFKEKILKCTLQGKKKKRAKLKIKTTGSHLLWRQNPFLWLPCT